MSRMRTSSADSDGDVKRARLGSWSERQTLENLPIELFEYILIKTIVMEVKAMKLANSVWTKKADLVIRRLSKVSLHWNNILTTDFFRNELHRTLDSAHETRRLEILHQSPIPNSIQCMETIRDEIYLVIFQLPLQDYSYINVYDRNNMAVVKDVISLSGIGVTAHRTAACSVSNCLYILNRKITEDRYSILRIARGNDSRFIVEPIVDLQNIYLPHAGICVSPTGHLILVRQQTEQTDAIIVYDGYGNLQSTRRLPVQFGVGMFEYDSVTVKSNGNLVVDQIDTDITIKLKEITMNGEIVRKYRSRSVNWNPYVCDADHNGRMLISDSCNRMEILDSEFNRMDFSGPQLVDGQTAWLYLMRYNVNRDELVAITIDSSYDSLLTIFRLS